MLNESESKYVLIAKCDLPIHMEHNNEIMQFYEFLACMRVTINEFHSMVSKLRQNCKLLLR